VNQFIEECRREWRRLRVPDPVADEMAADLAADLEEAEAEGASAEDVLGTGASDARSFAASWAAERGVVPPPPLTARPRTRFLIYAATAALAVMAASGAALVIFASPASTLAIHMVFATPTVLAGDAPPPPPPGVEANGSGVDIHPVGSILLTVGIVGVILSLLFLFWSSRARRST
jgi:hypothetical protein